MKKNDLVIAWLRFIEQQQLLGKGDKVLLAVSGGLDSVVMTHLFKTSGFPFGIGHCNFQLRGEEANEDETFVKNLAEKLGAAFYSTRFDTKTFVEEHNISIQMAARDLRYEWLEQVRKENGYYFIATAHHKNDNIETLLMNLTKGTGLAGLHGILPKAGHLLRPLLCFTRKELEGYAKDNQLEWREDRSNSETKYQRNHLRHEVIPQLEKINPRAVESLAEDIERFREMDLIYRHGLKQLLKKLVEDRKGDQYLSIAKLKLYPAPKTLLFEVMRHYGFNETQAGEVFAALDNEEAKQFYSESHRLIKDRKFLIITGLKPEETNIIFIGENALNRVSQLPGFSLKYHLQAATNYRIPESTKTAAIDFDLLQFPLTLRRWKTGDYFYPAGMKRKKKKLSKFFMDSKLPLLEKENAWVLLSGEKIVWVIGQRLDERFKVMGGTKRVLEVVMRNASTGTSV